MATKWKGITARLSVKICCWILIPVMAFIFLLSGFRIVTLADNHEISLEILVSNYRSLDNSSFFDRYAYRALYHVESMFGYKSEENIRAENCIEWVPVDGESGRYELVSRGVANKWHWGTLHESELESPQARRMIESAITSQLHDFNSSSDWLNNARGLYFYITDGPWVILNVYERKADFFTSQPVYIIKENGRVTAESHVPGYGYYNYDYHNYDYHNFDSINTTAYIAFSEQAVNYQNWQWQELQRELYIPLAMMVASVLAAIMLLMILISGAGLRRGDTQNLRFTALDRLWLDISLAAIIIFEIMLAVVFIQLAETAWRYAATGHFILTLLLLYAVTAAVPALWWILSFTKRCKAGDFWRHTMTFVLLRGITVRAWIFTKSLWAGIPLTLKAALVTIALTAAMLVTYALPPMSFVFAAIIFVLLLRFARKLYLLERGAKAAYYGLNDEPIAVKGGELGSIARSINGISEGINAAVAERLKSERLKTELITNVSHDIRTPLTSLITYTDLLKSEGLNSQKAPEYLDILIQKSARLKALTDDLFEASKAASGDIEVHIDNLDLADFVRQVLGELDERVKASGLDFRLNLPEHAPVRADGKLMWRVMENLLSNVFKYALPGSRVYVDIVPEDENYRLEIKNISEQELNLEPTELTERFKRGDDARAGEGSGLGLSIAQSFVQSQGGRFALTIDGDLFKAAVYLPKGDV